MKIVLPAAVAGLFITPTDMYTVMKQSQVYKNHVFDAKGNLSSFTYADGVLQKTSWYCK